MTHLARKPQIKKIRMILKATYPNVKTPLRHRNPFELLVATILSAQCTDAQVNKVTPALFNTLATPKAFAEASLATIEKLIRSTGFYRNKARNLQQCSRMLIEKFNGRVPDRLDDLVTLPGVGRKTANVVLGTAFNIPGIVVDTHVARLSRRLGFTGHKDPVKIEQDLMPLVPRKEWSAFSLRLVFHGRAYCKARNPDCANCPLQKLCCHIR